MKFSSKEQQILFVFSAVIGLYDFFTLHFNTFFITTIFAVALYCLTNSLYVIAFVYIVPQFIKLFYNSFFLSKDGFQSDPTSISNRLTKIQQKYSQGVNLNPETPKESFTDLKEVSNRVQGLQKNTLPKVDKVAGVVDVALPAEYPIEGNPSYPDFMKQSGTPVDVNGRIYTTPEESIPAIGIMDSFPKQNPFIKNYDELSMNTALAKGLNNIPNASNIMGV